MTIRTAKLFLTALNNRLHIGYSMTLMQPICMSVFCSPIKPSNDCIVLKTNDREKISGSDNKNLSTFNTLQL